MNPARESDFVAVQRAYWQGVDEAHYRWQTGAGYIAETEARLLESVIVRPGERLLEIGCGEGANLHHLAARAAGAHLFGCDFSPQKARFAQQRSGARCVAADAAHLPFAGGCFDAVLIRDLLHHLPDRQAALVEAARVLRPGGRLTLIEPNGRNPLIAAMAALITAERGMLASTAGRCRDEVEAAGFEVSGVERRQALPLSRVVFHYQLGAPSWAVRPSAVRLVARLEKLAERLPGAMWAYLVIPREEAVTDLSRKRVLVTGGAGFLGSFVVEALGARGVREVFVPRSRDYDLVDGAAVKRLLAEARPEVIIHLAARVGGIGANRDNPGRFFYENLMMGVQLVDEARRAGVEKLVLAGTICAYPKFAPVPFVEDDLWNGYPEETNAPYGLAKKMLLVQAQAYRQQYGTNAIVLFPVNLYGPRDNFDLHSSHVIPALIRKVDAAMQHAAPSVEIWGDGTPTREFLYVADAAEGMVLAAERYDGADPVNLGSGREIAIADLARLVGRLMGYSGQFAFDSSKPNGQPRRSLDVRRATERFGFTASVGLEEGLLRTIAWWREQPRV